jgi:hypothetical protein
MSLDSRSRTPSPNKIKTSITLWEQPTYDYYGSVNLMDRSRSPSPGQSSLRGRPLQQTHRQMPPPPPRMAVVLCKPTSLQIGKKQSSLDDHLPKVLPSPTYRAADTSPSDINFPRVNDSPSERGSAAFFPTSESKSVVAPSMDITRATIAGDTVGNHAIAPAHYLARGGGQQQLMADSRSFDVGQGRIGDRGFVAAPNGRPLVDANNHLRLRTSPRGYQQQAARSGEDSDDDDWC